MKDLFFTDYLVHCPSPQKLYALLKEHSLQTENIVSDSTDDSVRLSVSFFRRRHFEKLLTEHGFAYEKQREGAFCKLPALMKARAGLLTGAAICAAAILTAQYFVLTVDVLTDDETIRRDVMNVMLEDGVTLGRYIPSVNCLELERDLKQRVTGISWAGVSITDSRLVIDVIKSVGKSKRHYDRMPSNLVAKHSGTIEKAEIYNGLLKTPVGSGVLRGDLLVSGRIPVRKREVHDGEKVIVESEKCVRSIGTLYGRYTEVRTFEQPYSEQSMVMNGSRDDRRYLCVFGAEIPLFIGGDKGLYRETEEYSQLDVFGNSLPVGIKKVRREGYGFSAVNYSREQAAVRADEKRLTYEQNFLAGERIISRKIDSELTENCAKLTVTYELYGVMSEEREFFIKK